MSDNGESRTTRNREVLDRLIRSAEITRDARFQANLRLLNRQKMSSYVISLLSLMVIFLSLVPNFVDVEVNESQLLLALSVISSAFIIFTNLLDSSSNFYHKGELLHKCARDVNETLLELNLLDYNAAEFTDQFQYLKKKYQEILNQCPVNHDNVDYRKARIQKPMHFVGRNYSKNDWLRRIQVIVDRFIHFLESNFWIAPHLILTIIVSIVTADIISRS